MIRVVIAAIGLFMAVASSSQASAQSHLARGTIRTELVPGPVAYRALLPTGEEDSLPGGLPLLLLLHGGGGDESFLADMRSGFEAAWKDGSLPPLVVVTPDGERSFYLDWKDGSQRWESFLLKEFLPNVQERFHTSLQREETIVAGISMGGLGSLRLAFKHPEIFGVVAGLEPGIESVARWDEVTLRDTFYRPKEILEERFGNPIDPEHWAANSPVHLAATEGARIAAADLAIYFECGDADMFMLTYGAERLHRLLFDQGISHEYRLVRGADHVGPSIPARFRDALAFISRQLAEPPTRSLRARTRGYLARKFIERSKRKAGWMRTMEIRDGDLELEVLIEGDGPTIVLLPSLGRGAHDFDDLSGRLARAGYRVVRPEPRGIGGSTGPMDGLTMQMLADDVATVIRKLGPEPVVVAGHAFGNRVARMVATVHPELVDRVILLAAGGRVPIPDEIGQALRSSFDESLSEKERLAAIGLAFFAEGHDSAVWRDGWHGAVALAQGQATGDTKAEFWWAGGGKPMLVIQPEEDRVAPLANAEHLAQTYPDRVHVVEIPGAGHALLPEQPEAVAAAILAWLRDL